MKRPRQWHVIGLLWLICLVPFPCLADNIHILLVLSGDAAPYQSFLQTFRQNAPGNVEASVLQQPEAFSGREKADLIVAVGLKASEWVISRTNLPVLAAMLPSYKYAELRSKYPGFRELSGIFVDQPWARQVSLLQAALPDRKNVGVLFSSGTNLDLGHLGMLLKANGDNLFAQTDSASSSLFDALENVLSHSEVLLAVPDSAVYNSNNIRNIMLSSYRHRVPLVGFSQAYVNAGALYALFSTPEQLAAQASTMVALFMRSGRLPEAQFPKLFKIAVNQEVARMLGITIESAELLTLQVEHEGSGIDAQ
ncbi:MAG: ABC transporter substrate-binding protein [Burkholderiales bacterium]